MTIGVFFIFLFHCLLLLFSVESANALTFTGGTVYATEGVTDDEQTVLLGALFPIHGPGMGRINPCGNIRRTNVQLAESMVFAIETINNDSSLLPNVSMAFNIRDSCTSVNYALQQSVGYVQSVSNSVCDANGTLGVSGVVGTSLSTISQATANLFGLFEIPQVSHGSTSPSLSSDQFQYFFRTIPSDEFQAKAMADLVIYFKWDYIIILHSDDLYGVDGATALRAELEAKNGSTCIATQFSLSRNPPNYEKAVDEMSRVWVNNASVIVLFGHSEDAASIFREIRRRQVNNDSFDLTNMTWIASDSWSVTIPREFHSLVRGMLGLFPATQRIPAFESYFSSLTPINNAQNPWFVELWETQFNCSLGNSPELPSNCTLVNQSLNFPPSRQVPLVLDAVYALAHALDSLINANCPNRTLCSEITISGGAVNGSMLRDHLLNVSFDSTLGRVDFDNMGDIRQASYSIFNLQTDTRRGFRFRNVGLWSDGSLDITENIEWVTDQAVPPPSICSEPCKPNEVKRVVPDQTSCCFTCEACVGNTVSRNGECMRCSLGTVASPNQTMCELLPQSYLKWSDPWGLTVIIITSIGIIATAAVTIVFVIFYKHEIIRASSRELSAILLFGILLCYIVPFFYISMPSPALCGVQRFSIGFCFAISYSALLIKTHRIHRIFNRPSSSMNAAPLRFISPISQVVFTLCLVGIQVLISVVWLIAEPPETVIVETMNTRELQCGSNPYIGFSVFLGYNLILLILSTYFAFRTRKVPANFNEAKFINITLYTICIIWLAFLPIHFATVGLGNLFRTLTLLLGVIFSAGTTLGCLFISKVFILLTRIKKEKKIESMSKSEAAKVQSLSTSIKM